jgi:hypothetical protein
MLSPAHAIYKGEEEKGHVGVSRYIINSELDNKHACTATLVAPDIFISTAWCMMQTRGEKWFYRSKTGEKTELKIVHTLVHPQFDPSKTSWGTKNIGIFRLEKPISDNFGDLYKTIPTGSVENGAIVTIAGFGRVENENGLSAGVFRAAQIKTSVSLKSMVATPQLLTLEMVANDKPMSSACTGDLGGGVFVKSGGQDQLIGMLVGLIPPRDTVPNTCGGQTLIIHLGNIREWLVNTITILRAREIAK